MKHDLEQLLKHVKAQRAKRRYGIGLKSSYIADLGHCFEGGHCPSRLFRNAPSGEALERLFKEAEQAFTYCNKSMVIEESKASESADDGSILEFDFIATSKKKDRDGDVLDPSGAQIDEKMPLLWQHIPFEPIGRMTQVLNKNSMRIKMRACILGTDLGKDAALLVRGGALRISHGFMPIDYEMMEDKDGNFDGWHIKKYEMMEVSVVSIPSNTDAVITAYSQSKFHHPAVKGWAKSMFDKRVKSEPVLLDLKSLPAGTKIKIGGSATKDEPGCSCKTHGDLEEKGVVTYSATPTAPKDRAWDADAAEGRLREWAGGKDDLNKAKYRKGFAYVEGDGSDLGNYKLPHHDIIDGELKVVWKGVVAARAAADGSRGGMDLGDDKAGVLSHLDKHYKQFGEDPPGKDDDDGKSAVPEIEIAESLMTRTLDRIAFYEDVPVSTLETFVANCQRALQVAKNRQVNMALAELFN